ncbi:MAG: hypothetical protein C4K47_02100 [Candidatus Thorarchaeota archaeon]|nr:MAG: hypothetical protein C4K47_02100 [Candidatus Thorarchaeota archaeon]
MNIHNRTSFLLCFIGGVLLILSAASGTIVVIDEIIDDIAKLFGPDFVVTAEIVMGILAVLTFLGGVGVIVGGFVFTTERVDLGRKIVLVSVATGVVGLLISLVQSLMAGDPILDLTFQIAQSLGWVGAILSVEARIVAEQRPVGQSEPVTQKSG